MERIEQKLIEHKMNVRQFIIAYLFENRQKPNMESVKYTRHKTKKASFEVHKEEYTSEIDLFSTQEILRKCVL